MAAEIDDDEKYLYGENGESKDGVAEIKDKKLDPEAEAFVSVANETSKKDGSSQGNNADENDDEDSYEDDDDDDDDDVQVTIDEVTTAGAYGASFGAGVNWAAKGTAAPIKPTTGVAGDAKRLDIEAVGQVNDVSIYEYDIDLGTDEKPWRKPGADITDFFNYGFTEDTWKQYCERQRRLRMEVSGQKKQFVPGTGMIPTVAGLSADPNALKPKTEGTIDVIVESRRRTGVEEPVMAFPPPDMNFVRGGFPRPFHKTFPAGPMQVPPPGMFPRHPNMPPGMRPAFMPPPMGAGFQIPVAPPSEAPTSISNPPASGAPTSSSAGTIQGSAADGTGNVMAPPHAMMPPMGAQAGHLFAPDGTPLDGMAAGIQMPPGMPGSEMFARGPMDPFLQASGQMNSVFGAPWDMSAFHEQFTRSPERSDESDSENRRHRRRDKDRHREHRDRDKDRDRDRDRDRERRHRDRDRDRDRRDRDRDRDKDKERSRTRDKERSSRRSERSKESKSDRKKPRSTSRQREDSEETETPRKKSRRSRPTEDSYQEEKEEGEASEE